MAETEGFVSLWQIVDILNQEAEFDQLSVVLHGFGGPIARGFFADPQYLLRIKTLNYLREFFSRKKMVPDEFITKDAHIIAKKFIDDFFTECLNNGFDYSEFPELFFTYEIVGKWEGSNSRKIKPTGDGFSIFCTRPFVETAFTLSAVKRYTEPLHFQLMKSLNPYLHSLPLYGNQWRNQNPEFNLINGIYKKVKKKYFKKTPTTAIQKNFGGYKPSFDRFCWFNSLRENVRDLYLSQAKSNIWDVVRRDKFEFFTRRELNPTEHRNILKGLFLTMTAFMYENYIKK